MFIYYYDHWDYWQLYQNVTFDGDNKLILIDPGITSVDVKRDIYSSWKEWVKVEDYAKYLPAIRSVGGDPIDITTGKYAGDIYFLMNGWRVVVDHNVNINGVLYTDDGGSPFIIKQGGGVTLTVSSLVQTINVTPPPTVQQIRQEMDANSVKLINILSSVLAIPTTINQTDVANAVWNAVAANHAVTGSTGSTLTQIKADTASIAINDITFSTLLHTILKYEKNRTKIDTTTSQLLVYDDDNVTVLQAFNLKDINGNPSVADVLERVPTL